MGALRTRWAALGAAVAVTLGAGGIGLVGAVSSGERVVFVPIDGCRVVDTRATSTVGPRATPVGADETYQIVGRGSSGDCVIPIDASALSLNVTALNATEATFITIWDGASAQPGTSSLNPAPDQPPTPNAVVTNLAADGRFGVYNFTGSVDVLVDVVGYYADHNHDDRYLFGDQIVTSHAPGGWIADTIVNPPLAINYVPDMTKVDGPGTVFMPLSAPVAFGVVPDQTAFRPTAVQMCLASVVGDNVVDQIHFFGVDGTPGSFTDTTDRATTGCFDYDLSGSAVSGGSFTIAADISGKDGYIMMSSVTVTWAAS